MLGSLKSRLALSNLAFSLAALIVLTLIFGLFLRQRIIDSNKSFIHQEALLVRADVQKAVREAFVNPGPVQEFYQRLSNDSRFIGKRIVFYNADQICQFDSSGYTSNRPTDTGCQSSGNWWVDRAIPKQSASGLISDSGRSFYAVQMPAGYGSVFVLIAPAGDIIPSLSVLAPGFLLALVASVLIWVIMSVFFGYSVSRPLHKIREAATAIAAGDYNRTVDIHSGGEIGDLASSFNHMVTQVRISNQTLKDFVANVSHDLRTPITVISGFAGSILDGTMASADDVHEAGSIIAAEASRMERLVDDLLQLTRLESGLKRFDRKPVSIQALTDRTIRRALTAHAGRLINDNVPSDLPLGWGDEELLERVLMNLINNSLAYTPASGRIAVSAEADDFWITVNVTDSGVGISPSDQSRIFERFFRGDKVRTGGEGHSGLGLPIVKEIVESHGGRVTVDSRLGRGSTFTFTIPALRPSHQTATFERRRSAPSLQEA